MMIGVGLGAMTQADATAYVTSLYKNILQRAPDSGGLAYWVGLLTSGQDTEAQEQAGFLTSSEYLHSLADQAAWAAENSPQPPNLLGPVMPAENLPASLPGFPNTGPTFTASNVEAGTAALGAGKPQGYTDGWIGGVGIGCPSPCFPPGGAGPSGHLGRGALPVGPLDLRAHRTKF